MSGRLCFLGAGLCLGVTIFSAAAASDVPLGQLTIVVYNQTDSQSVALAKFYAQQRSIPPDHLVGLKCSNDEEISREDYRGLLDAALSGAISIAANSRSYVGLGEEPNAPILRQSGRSMVPAVGFLLRRGADLPTD